MSIIDKVYFSFEAFISFLNEEILPIFPGLLLVIFCLIISLLIGFLFRVIFKMIRIDKWAASSTLSKTLQKFGFEPKSHVLLGNLVFWFVFIILLQGVARISGWKLLSVNFSDFTNMIPLLIGGIIIIVIGSYLARFVGNIARAILSKSGSKFASILGGFVYYSLMLVVITTALNFMGISTEIITANVAVIFGSVLLSFSIAFVFGSKDILGNILSSSYNKNNYKVGQKISIAGIEGEIIKITNISVLVKSHDKISVIPAKRLTDEIVEIKG